MTPWLLPLLVLTIQPGRTAFSVAPAQECAHAKECEGAKWSEFYGTWVRQETAQQGEARYGELAAGLESAIERVLCRRLDQSNVEGCTPEPIAIDPRTKKLVLGPIGSAALLVGIAVPESGLREDVQVGRGSAKEPSEDGGRGRGPGMEGCVTQIHPTSAWRFADADPEVIERARNGDREAREAVVQTLLGRDRASIERCWTVALRLILHCKARCAWMARRDKKDVDWDYATVSLYGTGETCYSENLGKTMKRVSLFRKLRSQMVVELRRARAKEKAK